MHIENDDIYKHSVFMMLNYLKFCELKQNRQAPDFSFPWGGMYVSTTLMVGQPMRLNVNSLYACSFSELIMRHGVCIRVLGDLELLPRDVLESIARVVNFSRNNNRWVCH